MYLFDSKLEAVACVFTEHAIITTFLWLILFISDGNKLLWIMVYIIMIVRVKERD